jgi:adenylate kinase
MLGPPASGKGTQGERLARALGVPHVAAGTLLRKSIEEGDPHGIEEKVANGDLVPDEVVEELLTPELGGYPRTAKQAERLDALLARLGQPLEVAVELDADDSVLVARMMLRAEEEKRSDDRPEVFIKRLEDYREEAKRLRDHYGDRLVRVSAEGSEDEVFERLMSALGDEVPA